MSGARTLRVLAAAGLLVAGVVRGQEPVPAKLGASVLGAGGTAQLVLPWRFHPGDDLLWADPGTSDAGWAIVAPRLSPADLPGGEWHGVGWFRRRLEVNRALWGVPLAIRVVGVGTADVYVDGARIARFGPASASAAAAVAAPPTLAFSGRTSHLLAVRYSLPDAAPYARLGLDLGFLLTLEEPQEVLASRRTAAGRSMAFDVALTVVPLLLGCLHLGLFGFYRKARENLFYALYMLSFAVIVFAHGRGLGLLSDSATDLLRRSSTAAVIAAILFGLFTYYAIRTRPYPRSWIAFALAAPVVAGLAVLRPGEVAAWCWYAFFAATVVEIVRVEIAGRTVAPEGGRTLSLGLLVIYGAVALQVLVNVGVVPSIEGFSQIYVVAILAAAFTMSLSLARSFAQTRVHLEKRLGEVEELSGRVLDQERVAHARELRQRLLEVENARKSAELEAARTLQLSMLPGALPEAPGLDVAVAMRTASEVGGDYYDFRREPDGSLVLAVGDATGHGVAAGTMVTAVKALFTALGGGNGLAATLAECNRVLRSMNVRPLHMCLTLARVTPRRLELCSAGMPPVLLRRGSNGRVEELGAGGLPLGGRLAPEYTERAAALEPGDTVLFATDGFAELVDPAGTALGYDGAVDALSAAAGGSAQEVVQRLRETADAWRGPRELADDVTFVVVRVRNGRG